MPVYMVSYDLRRERSMEDYLRVYDTLRSAGTFCWPLYSVWIIETPLAPSGVINALVNSGAVDDDDGLIVAEMTLRADWRRVRNQETASWLNANLVRS